MMIVGGGGEGGASRVRFLRSVVWEKGCPRFSSDCLHEVASGSLADQG